MAKQEIYITDEQWKNLESLLPKHKQSPKGGRSQSLTEKFLKVSYGYFVAEQNGKICLTGIHHRVLAGEDYSSGKNRAYGLKSGVSSCRNWTNEASWTGKKHLPMAVSHRQKKGAVRWKNQTWKGYEVDGGGRWQRNPSRCSSRFGLAE